MKSISNIVSFAIIMICGNVQAQSSVLNTLLAEMNEACPVLWEDLGVPINALSIPNDVWQGNQQDADDFIAKYMADYSVTTAEATQVAATPAAVASVCGSYRISVLDTLNANNSIDVTIATETAANPDSLIVEPGAPAASLVVDSTGNIGLGTGSPTSDLHIQSSSSVTQPMVLIENAHAGNTTLKVKNSGAVNTELSLENSIREWKIRNNTIGDLVLNVPGDSGFEFELKENGDLNAQGQISSSELLVKRHTGASKIILESEGLDLLDHAELYLNTDAQSWKIRSNSKNDSLAFINHDTTTTPLIIRPHAAHNLLMLGEDPGGTEVRVNGSMILTGTITTSGTTCGGGCDAVFTKDYSIPTIDEHAAQMWRNKHLPNVGPTIENEPFNLTHKVGGILNELETAHIYIEQLHQRLESQSEQSNKRIEDLAAAVSKLEEKLSKAKQ